MFNKITFIAIFTNLLITKDSKDNNIEKLNG